MKDNFAAQAPIGIYTRKHTYQYYLLRELDDLKILPASKETIFADVSSGKLSAAIVSPPDSLGDKAQRLLPTIFDRRQQFSLLVSDPISFLHENRDAYGIKLIKIGTRMGLELDAAALINFTAERSNTRSRLVGLRNPNWNQSQLVLNIPTSLMSVERDGIALNLALNWPEQYSASISASCGGKALNVTKTESGLQIILPQGMCRPDAGAALTPVILDKNDRDRIGLIGLTASVLREQN